MYTWTNHSEKGEQIGLLAGEVRIRIPEVVREDSMSGMLSVNYVGLLPVSVKALKEQDAQLDNLRTDIQSQEDRLALLEGESPILGSVVPSGLGGGVFLALVLIGLSSRLVNRPSRSGR
jgi:hypothetical protein